jgi:hypothetical protein
VLNKLLFYSDFYYYAKHGKSITGAKYRKEEFGIVPSDLVEARGQLIDEGKLIIDTREHQGRTQKRPKTVGSPKIVFLSKEEMSFVDEIVKRFGDKNGSQISSYNHKEAPYQFASEGEEIPYRMSYLLGNVKVPAKVMKNAIKTAKELNYKFVA